MKASFWRGVFWCTWPLIWLYAPLHHRPRVLVMCGAEFLAVKPFFSSGTWQLPGGGMHGGEPAVSAAARELAEETGVVLAPETFKLLLARKVFKENGLSMRYSVFLVGVPAKPTVKVQKNEIAEYAWLSLNDIPAGCSDHLRESLAALSENDG